jgi:hypothetical protein
VKAIEKKLKYQWRNLRQLKRTGMIAIYDVRSRGEMLYGYEVVQIKVIPAGEIYGKAYPEREAYPSSAKGSNDWGTCAWSFGRNHKRLALACFSGLVKAANGSMECERVPDVSDLG